MIGLDTNVLVRILVQDDPAQLAAAERLLDESAANGEECFLGDAVLCEMEWVLESNYSAKRADVVAALDEILGRPIFVFEDRPTLEKAVERYRHSKADLSDLLIGLKAGRHEARTTFTFDGVLGRLDEFSLLR